MSGAPSGRAAGYKAATVANGYPKWEYYLLKAIGAPANEAQLEALNLWARKEGLPGDTFNWLAITDPNGEFGPTGGDPSGAQSNGVWNYINGQVGVVTFPSFNSGIAALVSFLQHGHEDIVTALQDPNATVESIGAAVAKDGAWGGDGAYIMANGNTNETYQVYTNGASTGTGPDSTNNTFTNCNSSNAIIKLPGLFGDVTLLNDCQAKAIIGGLLTGLGFAIMAGGVAIIVTGAVERFELKDLAKQIGAPATKLSKRIFGSTTQEETVTTTKAPKPPTPPKVSQQERRAKEREEGIAQVQAEMDQRRRDNAAYYGPKKTGPRPTYGTRRAQARPGTVPTRKA